MKSRKLFALVGLAAMTLASCSNENKEGQVLNIHCWNTEFRDRFEKFYPDATKNEDGTFTLKNGHKVVFKVTANEGNAYQIALDAALKNQKTAKNKDKVDMFLMEADYALKYANSDYTMDVKDVGLTDADLADMYDYTKVIATDGRNGKLKGVSWQATPGLFAYRTDVAEAVFGTSDPDAVQAKLADWDKFNAAAAEAKKKGYYMLSGYDDSYRTFSNNASTAWADANGKLTLDPQIKNWIKQTKDYTEKGYSHKTKLWDNDWAKDQGPTADPAVLGFFYSTWGIDFTLKGNSLADKDKPEALGNGLYGKYRVCRGPANYYWGGTWLCAAEGTDNVEDIKDIMKVLTCDKNVAKSITEGTQDYTNNKTAMHEIATSDFGSPFLGGQNHIALFEQTAKELRIAAMSAYDQGCNENIQNAMHDYFAGTVDYKTAIANFKNAVKALYPEVTFDATFDADL